MCVIVVFQVLATDCLGMGSVCEQMGLGWWDLPGSSLGQ